MSRILTVEPLTIEAFEPFGDVIEPDNAREIRLINGGTTTRFHDLAPVDVSAEGGRPLISIFRGKPFAFPLAISMMERHPLGSQAFMPLSPRPFLIAVAPDEAGRPGPPRIFLGQGRGIAYARNTWHHPLIALEDVSDFLVVDRGGDGINLEEADYAEAFRVEG
ncbi:MULTISPECIES: ureidoglycolate lyase [unclassified Aureimonas]|uniref:ureidoglycolate lyase n=1 Tax=unclassified Aureimonas TaxID=2615206 RepID=UPI0007012517|nr:MULTISPECIES: ureidoglycolate lyase [unclassified Aureimonas]KQT69956.1 ureidoglycolate hydrolase [Aureimonas sp. Leaf427]KQT75888.1 ureidoglycolate hydrolase [Aureimonas sp. Leaf460]